MRRKCDHCGGLIKRIGKPYTEVVEVGTLWLTHICVKCGCKFGEGKCEQPSKTEEEESRGDGDERLAGRRVRQETN